MRKFNKDNCIVGEAHGKHVGGNCERDESGGKRVLDGTKLEYWDIRGRYNRLVFLYGSFRIKSEDRGTTHDLAMTRITGLKALVLERWERNGLWHSLCTSSMLDVCERCRKG